MACIKVFHTFHRVFHTSYVNWVCGEIVTTGIPAFPLGGRQGGILFCVTIHPFSVVVVTGARAAESSAPTVGDDAPHHSPTLAR